MNPTFDRISPPKRPLRVLTLVDGLPVAGGGETFASLLARHLDPERFERYLCVTRWSDDLAAQAANRASLQELSDAGVEFLGLARRRRADLRAWVPLARLVMRRRIDVIHAHKFGSNVWGSVIGRALSVPVVLAHEHSWSFEGNRVRRFLDGRVVGALADSVVAVSSLDQRRIVEVEGVDPRKVVLIPTSIAPPLAGSSSRLRNELGIAPGTPVVGTVGGLRPEKDIGLMLRAAARLVTRWPDLQLVVCGEGTGRAELERVAADLGLAAATHFLGWRDDTAHVIAAFDVAVCCSQREGSPLSVLEYMGQGKPVVATRVGGVPDLVEDRRSGILVAPGSTADLADAVDELLGDPGLAREMGRRGRDRQRTEFALEPTIARFEALYRQLYARRAG